MGGLCLAFFNKIGIKIIAIHNLGYFKYITTRGHYFF